MKRPTEQQLQKQCDAWNARYPIGTQVAFHPIIGGPECRIRTTKSAAVVLSGHTAVVWLDGESGCSALEACSVVKNGKLS